MKKIIRLTESELVRIVKRVVSEQEIEMQGTKCKRDNDCADALDMHLGGLIDKYKKVDNGEGRFVYVGTNQYGDSIKVLVPKKNDFELIILRKPKGLMGKSEELRFRLPEALGSNNSVNKWRQYLK